MVYQQRYYPNTGIVMPAPLRKWRAKFKTIGRNVFVAHQPTLEELVAKYGAGAKVTAKQLENTSWRIATPDEKDEYNAGLEIYKARTIEIEVKEAENGVRWQTKQLHKSEKEHANRVLRHAKATQRLAAAKLAQAEWNEAHP